MKICSSAQHGVHFSCKKCGVCCSAEQTGLVFVYWTDIKNMANHLNMKLQDFARQYLMKTEYEYILWDKKLQDKGKTINLPTLALNYRENEDCVFLKREKTLGFCQIYPNHPLQCQLYPFWNQIMRSENHFHLTKSTCPGFNNTKPSDFYSMKTIRHLLNKERLVEYEYIQKMIHSQFDITKIYPFLC